MLHSEVIPGEIGCWPLAHWLTAALRLASCRAFAQENNDIAGQPSTLGNPQNRGRVPDTNSEPVQRLLDAGAVIVGKTNLALDLNDVQSYNPVYGILLSLSSHAVPRWRGGVE